MGVAGPIFELQPSNLVRNHIFHSCKSAEILVRISQVVLDLAKIVWSVMSISSDVLDPTNPFYQYIGTSKFRFAHKSGKSNWNFICKIDLSQLLSFAELL